MRPRELELDELGALDTGPAQRELADQLTGLRAGVAHVRAVTAHAARVSAQVHH